MANLDSFDDQYIAIAGTFSAGTQKDVKSKLKKIGVKEFTKTKPWTVLLATDEAYQAPHKLVSAAMQDSLPILTEEWLNVCLEAGAYVPPEAKHYHSAQPTLARTSATTIPSPPASKEPSPDIEPDEEAKRQAEEEAARRAAAEEEKRKAEEAKQKADEEAKKKAEEAKKKADEEAKKKADKEKKQKAAEAADANEESEGRDDENDAASDSGEPAAGTEPAGGSSSSGGSQPSTGVSAASAATDDSCSASSNDRANSTAATNSTSRTSPASTVVGRTPSNSPEPVYDTEAARFDQTEMGKRNSALRDKHLSEHSDSRRIVLFTHPNDVDLERSQQRRNYEMTIECMTTTGQLLVTDPQTSHPNIPCARAGYLVRRSDYALAASTYKNAVKKIQPVSEKDILDGRPLTDFIWWTVAYNGRLCYAWGTLDGESDPVLFTRTTLKSKYGKKADTQIDEIRAAFEQPSLRAMKEGIKKTEVVLLKLN
ncbi:hypothetical protein MY10362_004770 [Beauveria mimosiformis]